MDIELNKNINEYIIQGNYIVDISVDYEFDINNTSTYNEHIKTTVINAIIDTIINKEYYTIFNLPTTIDKSNKGIIKKQLSIKLIAPKQDSASIASSLTSNISSLKAIEKTVDTLINSGIHNLNILHLENLRDQIKRDINY